MKKLLLTCLIILTAGCASSPLTVSYYLLDNDARVSQEKAPVQQHLLLKDISVANYLQQPELCILDDNYQLYFSSRHQWGEPLVNSIARVLNDDLLRSAAIQLVRVNDPDVVQANKWLKLNIDHFAPTSGGEVILAGTYWLGEGVQVTRQPFSYRTALEGDGYSQSVAKQRELLVQLSESIANQVGR
ncbi:PqiC family protein [Porticoccaceae bacterium LTM1]|nr:PqiC family protein [Porticoccaceae bacterium LTM1]